MGRKKLLFERRKNARQMDKRTPLIVSLPRSLYEGRVQSIESLYSHLSSRVLPESWSLVAKEPLTVVKLRVTPSPPTPKVDVIITLAVHNDFTWSMSVLNVHMNPTLNESLSSVNRYLTTCPSVYTLLEMVDSLLICVGNPDQKYLDLWKHRSSTLHGVPQNAFLDNICIPNSSTVRHTKCQLLVSQSSRSTRCTECIAYRKSLNLLYNRIQSSAEKDSLPTSHTNLRFQPITTVVERHRQLRQDHNTLRKQLQRMKDRILRLLNELESISVKIPTMILSN